MHRSVIFAAAALAAAFPAAAHAGTDASRDLSRSVRIAEVSADPRDGADTIELRSAGGFTHLELRAREALVDIQGLGLRMRGGRVQWLDLRARIAPGQQRTIELPPEARRADAIVVDYGDPELRRRDRTPARLELYGAVHDRWSPGHDDRYGYCPTRDDQRGDSRSRWLERRDRGDRTYRVAPYTRG